MWITNFPLFSSTSFTNEWLFCLSRSSSSTKAAPLNINKVSNSLLNFGRKLISPAMSGASTGISPINSEVHSSSSSFPPLSPSSVTVPILAHPLAEPPAPTQTQEKAQTQNYRLLKSESMPVHLSKGEQQDTEAELLLSDLFYDRQHILLIYLLLIGCYITGELSACSV